MTINALATTQVPAPPAPPAKPQGTEKPGQAPDAYTPSLSAENEKNDITIRQAAAGFAGAVAGAAIETVGNTASSIVNLPRATFYAAKALWNTEMVGPVLKTTLSMLLPVGAIAVPVLTALGSLGYGMFHGFGEGVKNGLGSAVRETAKDVKYFHKDVAKKAVDGLQQIETSHLPEGQQPYDIKLVEAGKGLVGAVAGAAIDGAGVGAITLVNTPRGVVKAYKEIFKSDQGPVLKTSESLLVLPAALLATPLLTVAGTVYGMYSGFGEAYKKGLGESVGKQVENVKEFNKLVNKAFD